MAIIVVSTEMENPPMGSMGETVAACDHCGKEITWDTPANVEHEHMVDGRAKGYLVHKKCVDSFHLSKPEIDFLWGDFNGVKVRD